MAAPQATQQALRRSLFRTVQRARHLRPIAPATCTLPQLTRDHSAGDLPHNIAGRRAESKQRMSDGSGFNRRTDTHTSPLANSQAFGSSLRQPRRPSAERTEARKPRRQFHTSRTLPARNDSSTIDFAFLPELVDEEVKPYQMRMPIIPDNYSAARAAPEVDEVVMKPEISAMSADAVFHPMAELSDGQAMNLDFNLMADTFAANVKKMRVPVEKQAGLMKQIFNDMVDDMLGASKKASKG